MVDNGSVINYATSAERFAQQSSHSNLSVFVDFGSIFGFCFVRSIVIVI